ncbi:lantibiotic dehydratase [Amycolatopsis decaplanina]|uniref:Lantibiotic dehydratase domain-containing protein n=1 Tax=Amycolatopsis decaplanina DSM 44594 TaxID=1284240 RepID=M2YCA1_9PSEU|nr:lantibiotic dehydratase [Amycolatopsis decaplanina]EME52492.1 lantibiotic dehydratase domain-containing protein [Amycolatopsis decaplanina DSM 44594]
MVRLSGKWRLWDQFAVRGAGFPAAGVLRLAEEGLAAAADRLDVDARLSGPAWDVFEKQFATTAVETAVELQSIASSPGFRAAVEWQNSTIWRTGVESFLAWEPSVAGRTSKPRQREELVAQYWQRFCVKNDTIGFFGPVGWGRWDEAASGVEVEPGSGLITTSNVYFAGWAVDAVARAIGADPRSRNWVAPRRVPFVRVTGELAHLPGRSPQVIPAELRPVLELCDGVRSAQEIQQELGPAIDVAAAVTELVRLKVVVWRLDVPASAYPERYLRTWLASVGETRLREQWLARLDELERGRDRVRTSTAAELPVELAALESGFTTMTGSAATRVKGTNTAPCRGLVYSDCVRAARARLGTDMLAELAPIDLLLTSATWLTARLAGTVLSHARRVHTGLAAAGPVDLAAFWFACMPILHGTAVAEAAALRRELSTRWARILDVPDGARRVRMSSVDIADRVRDEFGDPVPGWDMARYLSPDVFIVPGADTEWVLGELHVASNTLGASLFVNQHPVRGELLDETAADFPGPRLLPMLPKEHKSRLSARIRYSLDRQEDYYVALVDHTVDPERDRTVLSAEVLVEARGDRLVAVLPDGAEFDVLDAFGHVLTTLAMDLFRIMPDADHSPRVTVDKLVVARESWSVPVESLSFASEKSEARRFVLTRRWRERLGLPRFVFVVSPGEPRPFYVDFDAPVYVSIFAKAVRRLVRQDPAGRLSITEMLPSPEQAWLTDDKGNRYTSELRFVAVHR